VRGVEVDVALKVNVPNLVTYLNRSPLFEWCVVSDYMTGESRVLDDETSCYPTTAVITVLLNGQKPEVVRGILFAQGSLEEFSTWSNNRLCVNLRTDTKKTCI